MVPATTERGTSESVRAHGAKGAARLIVRQAQASLLPGQRAVSPTRHSECAFARRAQQRRGGESAPEETALWKAKCWEPLPRRTRRRQVNTKRAGYLNDLYLQIFSCICYGSTVTLQLAHLGVVGSIPPLHNTTVMSEGWQTSFVVSMCVLFALFKPLLILMCSPSPKRTGGWWQLSGLGW